MGLMQALDRHRRGHKQTAEVLLEAPKGFLIDEIDQNE
jgi:hypothetical protein